MDKHKSSSYMGKPPMMNRNRQSSDSRMPPYRRDNDPRHPSNCRDEYRMPDNSDSCVRYTRFRDFGPDPFVADLAEITKVNNTFRTAIWTGCHLQLTVMSIPACSDIGVEIHPDVDQFLYIEEGRGLVKMGCRRDCLRFQRKVCDGYAIFVPAGTWHNVINAGNKPLKLFSIYAPPEHPHSTVHLTKAIAEAAEMNEPY